MGAKEGIPSVFIENPHAQGELARVGSELGVEFQVFLANFADLGSGIT